MNLQDFFKKITFFMKRQSDRKFYRDVALNLQQNNKLSGVVVEGDLCFSDHSNHAEVNMDGKGGSIVINGTKYRANSSISIKNGEVYIDGKPAIVEDKTRIIISIVVEGNASLIDLGAGTVKVFGDVNEKIRIGAGDIEIHGSVKGDVNTDCGDITCSDVTGNVNTDCGDVECGSVGGNVHTDCGNVKVTK